MELYVRFIVTLAAGLLGLGIVMKVVFDEMFSDWDAVSDFVGWLKGAKTRGIVLVDRAEDVMLEIEKAKQATAASSRLMDQKREELREIQLVESRLMRRAAAPVVLTPIRPLPVAPAAPAAVPVAEK